MCISDKIIFDVVIVWYTLPNKQLNTLPINPWHCKASFQDYFTRSQLGGRCPISFSSMDYEPRGRSR